jgi:hypothetical protein
MNLTELYWSIIKPLTYLTIWVITMIILFISMDDLVTGFILFIEITRAAVIGISIYAALMIILWVICFSNKK